MDDPTRAHNALKRWQEAIKKKSNTFAHGLHELNLQAVVNKLNANMTNGGRLPYGKMDEILESLTNLLSLPL
jgi:hypothetical protein